MHPRKILVSENLLTLTLFKVGFFVAAYGWEGRGGGKKPTLFPKICHTYPRMMKLGTVIPYLKMIKKIDESRDTRLVFCKEIKI